MREIELRFDGHDGPNGELWAEGSKAVVAGLLDEVNLRTDHALIVDDVGNHISLIDVRDRASAATLVGHRVLAKGIYLLPSGSGQARMEQAQIRPFELPAELAGALDPAAPDLTDLPTHLPPMSDGFALDDDEFDAFLAAIHD